MHPHWHQEGTIPTRTNSTASRTKSSDELTKEGTLGGRKVTKSRAASTPEKGQGPLPLSIPKSHSFSGAETLQSPRFQSQNSFINLIPFCSGSKSPRLPNLALDLKDAYETRLTSSKLVHLRIRSTAALDDELKAMIFEEILSSPKMLYAKNQAWIYEMWESFQKLGGPLMSPLIGKLLVFKNTLEINAQKSSNEPFIKQVSAFLGQFRSDSEDYLKVDSSMHSIITVKFFLNGFDRIPTPLVRTFIGEALDLDWIEKLRSYGEEGPSEEFIDLCKEAAQLASVLPMQSPLKMGAARPLEEDNEEEETSSESESLSDQSERCKEGDFNFYQEIARPVEQDHLKLFMNDFKAQYPQFWNDQGRLVTEWDIASSHCVNAFEDKRSLLVEQSFGLNLSFPVEKTIEKKEKEVEQKKIKKKSKRKSKVSKEMEEPKEHSMEMVLTLKIRLVGVSEYDKRQKKWVSHRVSIESIDKEAFLDCLKTIKRLDAPLSFSELQKIVQDAIVVPDHLSFSGIFERDVEGELDSLLGDQSVEDEMDSLDCHPGSRVYGLEGTEMSDSPNYTTESSLIFESDESEVEEEIDEQA